MAGDDAIELGADLFGTHRVPGLRTVLIPAADEYTPADSGSRTRFLTVRRNAPYRNKAVGFPHVLRDSGQLGACFELPGRTRLQR
jgi:hypothetical protein